MTKHHSIDSWKTFTGVLERSANKLWGAHVRVPPQLVNAIKATGTQRVVCRFNEAAEHQTALLPYRRNVYVVRVNRQLQKKLGVSPGEQVEVSLKKDETLFGLPVPEELEELLRQDAEGRSLFHSLTPGKQRTLLYIVGSVKDPDKRIHRALAIVQHLKFHKGKIDYKKLYGSLRDKRNRLR